MTHQHLSPHSPGSLCLDTLSTDTTHPSGRSQILTLQGTSSAHPQLALPSLPLNPQRNIKSDIGETQHHSCTFTVPTPTKTKPYTVSPSRASATGRNRLHGCSNQPTTDCMTTALHSLSWHSNKQKVMRQAGTWDPLWEHLHLDKCLLSNKTQRKHKGLNIPAHMEKHLRTVRYKNTTSQLPFLSCWEQSRELCTILAHGNYKTGGQTT